MKYKNRNIVTKHSRKVQRAAAQNKVDDTSYARMINKIKTHIQRSQIKAAISVNRELIKLYLFIGQQIIEKQKKQAWGKSIVEKMSKDLKISFPELKGFSSRNLWDMRRLAEACEKEEKLRQLVAEIPWGHNLVLLNSVKDLKKRIFYIKKTIENGWSRSVLVHQIESGLFERQGKALTNFKQTLPPKQTDLAQELMKDPYHFDFLGLSEKISERELENALLSKLKQFLIELGVGFSFIASQYHLEVGGKDYYIDLLFYHTKLHCYIVIDLKITDFIPEYAGKMNFYLSAIDSMLASEGDNPSIGIILCKTKNKIVVEYALRNVKRPMGVASYQLRTILPKTLKGQLPSPKDFKKGLEEK